MSYNRFICTPGSEQCKSQCFRASTGVWTISPEVGKLLHTRNGESEPNTKPGSQVVQADVQAEPYTKAMLMTAKEQFLPVGIQKGGQND